MGDIHLKILLYPLNKYVRSAKDMRIEVNRAKHAKRELRQVIEHCFGGIKGWRRITYQQIFSVFCCYLRYNIPLSRRVERELKVSLDYTKRSKRERQWIRWHAVAQIIALENPRKTVPAIKSEIIGDRRLDRLLERRTLPSLGNSEKNREDRFRKIEDAIGEVVKWGVGRPAKGAQSTVVVSPLVYSGGKVNFLGLFEAMSAVGSIPKIWDRPLNYIFPVLELYEKTLPDSPVIHAFIDVSIAAFYNRLGAGKYYD